MTPDKQLAEIALIFANERTIEGKLNLRLTVSTNAYNNLSGAIIDMEHNGERADKVVMRTLKRVEDQLERIEKILGEGGWLK